MKLNNKKIFIISASLLMLFVTGCAEEGDIKKEQIVKIDEEIDMATEINTEDNDYSTLFLEQILDVPYENFKVKAIYDTGKYNLSKWHVTDNKILNMTLHTVGLPEGYEVYVDHMHVDVSLVSTKLGLNGITQDSMDDTSHVLYGLGFYIDNNTVYNNTFQIEGYNNEFYEIYGHTFGSYGSVSSTYTRLTEKNLLENGVKAQEFNVVYDLYIKKSADDKGHTVSVYSEFLVPVSQAPMTELQSYIYQNGEWVPIEE